MSLVVVAAPTLTIIRKFGLWIHGQPWQSTSVPVNIDVDVVVLRRHGRRPSGGPV